MRRKGWSFTRRRSHIGRSEATIPQGDRPRSPKKLTGTGFLDHEKVVNEHRGSKSL